MFGDKAVEIDDNRSFVIFHINILFFSFQNSGDPFSVQDPGRNPSHWTD